MAMSKSTTMLGVALSLCLFASTASSHDPDTGTPSRRLVLIQGSVLYAYFQNRYQEIRRGKIIYGHGWLDDHRVFVAYQPEKTGEAMALLDVIDLRNSHSTNLTFLGGAGEANFDVNPATGAIVFAAREGVRVLRISDGTAAYKIEEVTKETWCFGTFWIDTKTVGCIGPKDGQKVFMRFSVPPAH